jgi:hypothetical protein
VGAQDSIHEPGQHEGNQSHRDRPKPEAPRTGENRGFSGSAELHRGPTQLPKVEGSNPSRPMPARLYKSRSPPLLAQRVGAAGAAPIAGIVASAAATSVKPQIASAPTVRLPSRRSVTTSSGTTSRTCTHFPPSSQARRRTPFSLWALTALRRSTYWRHFSREPRGSSSERVPSVISRGASSARRIRDWPLVDATGPTQPAAHESDGPFGDGGPSQLAVGRG